MKLKNVGYFDYWYWPNVISQSNIKVLNNYIENNCDGIENPDAGARDNQGKLKKNTSVKVIKWFKIRETMDYIIDQAYEINNEHFGYNLYNTTAEKELLHSTYSSSNQGHYDWHTDSSGSHILDCKLTVIINLSEQEYEGGDFQYMLGNIYDIKEFSKPGSMIMFKSFLNHRVLPVTKGERKSLTMFLNGPRFI